MKNIFSGFTNDNDVEQLVGKMLRYGVVTASLIAFVGGIMYLFEHGSNSIPAYNVFKGEGAGYTSFGGIIKGALSFSSTEIVQLGVLVLIATPIMRILLSLFAFALEKDKLYVVITLVVLCVIMTSIFGGLKV